MVATPLIFPFFRVVGDFTLYFLIWLIPEAKETLFYKPHFFAQQKPTFSNEHVGNWAKQLSDSSPSTAYVYLRGFNQ